MSLPEQRYWNPLRIALWGLAALAISAWLGPKFIDAFRPPSGIYVDFVQEWLSARNYTAGMPVYSNQTEALWRHTGDKPLHAEDMLPWNAHPPASVVLTLPFGRWSYEDAQYYWNLVSFPLFVLSVLLVVRELKFPLSIWSVLPAIVLLLLFNPLYVQLEQGQLNPPILFLITLGWIADRRGYQGWAGAAIGVAAGLKLYPAFLFAYFLFTRRWRAILTGGIAFLVVNGIAAGVLGREAMQTYVQEVVPSLKNYQSNWRNVSLNGYFIRVFNPNPRENTLPLMANATLATSLILVGRLLVMATVVWAAVSARSREARDRAFAAAIVGMLLVSPITWNHYFLLLVPVAGLLWMRLPSGVSRWALALVLILLWLPDLLFASLAIGPKQAGELVHPRHPPISAKLNMGALSIQAYALFALFLLVFRLPTQPTSEKVDEQTMDRRLFGPSNEGTSVEPAPVGP